MTHPLTAIRHWIAAGVRSDAPDLSTRQMAVLMTVYTEDGPHTVRGMAASLNVSKPAITRALDRLSELDLVRRKIDPMDRRSVLAQRTAAGAAALRRMEADWHDAQAAATQPAKEPAHA